MKRKMFRLQGDCSDIKEGSGFNMSWLKELNINPKVIFDVGCYDGNEAIRFRKKWNDADIYAFEANSYVLEKYKHNMVKNNIIMVKYGVLDDDGEAEFWPGIWPGECKQSDRKDTPWSTYLKEFSSHQKVKSLISYLDPIKIKVICLHSFCKEKNIKEIDILHVDTEGTEIRVIKGLKGMRPKVIYAEQNNSIISDEEIDDFKNYMKEQNYILQKMCWKSDYFYVDERIIYENMRAS